jgi:hypothetical protein
MIKIEATYYCELHGMWTISIVRKDAPQYMDCPSCSDGSKGILASAVYTQQPNDAFDDARDKLVGGGIAGSTLTVDQMRRMMEALSGLNVMPYGSKPPTNMVLSDRRRKSEPLQSLETHEAQERAKMLQAIDEA